MIKFLLRIIRFVNYLLIVAFVFLMGVMFSILYIEDPDYSGTYKNEKNDTEFFTLHKTNTYIMMDENNKEKAKIRVKKTDNREEIYEVTILGETKIGEIIDEKIVMDKDNSTYKK